jgi:predicted transcriptional regulator
MFNELKSVDLIEWRLKNNISQRKLATILKYDISTVWRYEHKRLKIPSWMGCALYGIERLIEQDRINFNK